jgi:glycosyltransferase involved in cell wall biosynthesis
MGLGGAERVVSKLANRWSSRHNVAIVTLCGAASDFCIVNPSVQRLSIELPHKRWYNFSRFFRMVLRLRNIYYRKNPDYILSFLPRMNILSLFALLFSKKKLIICERNIINDPTLSRRIKFFRKLLYKKAYKITVQHEEIHSELLKTFPVMEAGKVVITPNPVEPFTSCPKIELSSLFGNYSPGDKVLLAAGRFTAVKAHKDTIAMFSFLKKKMENVKLIICGNGNEFEECRRLACELGLEDSAAFPGLVENIQNYYSASSLFVTTTHFEGFPNALTEALAAGLPAIAFNAPSISVFIKDGHNGFLIDSRNPEDMAEKVCRLLKDEALYKEFSENAAKISTEYSMDAIEKIWMEKVFT